MSTKVTLNLFSGRPNPTFDLTNEETREIEDICAAFAGATTAAPAGKNGGLLGYRGFQLERPAKERQAPIDTYVHAGIVDRGTFDNPVDPARMVERKLLAYASAKGAIPRELQAYLDKEVEGPPKLQGAPAAVPGGCPACNAADAPAYNPGVWNGVPTCAQNNCYNYANNQITNTFAQPGRHSGTPIVAMTCASVQQSAISDGLAVTPNFTALRAAGQGWYVALVIWPNMDYHWYRQDLTGCWSHKAGGTPATNLDNAGNAITNPALSNNGPYTTFCSYMVTSAAVVIS